MAKHNGKIDLVRAAIKEFLEIAQRTGKGISKHQIAEALYIRHPDMFKSKEDARTIVRYATMSMGSISKKAKNQELADAFHLLAEPIKEIDPTPYDIPLGYKKLLVIADIHSRFYDKRALYKAIEDGLKSNCQGVLINGDFMDFYQYSKFDKNPNIVADFASEQDWGVDLLSLLQSLFGVVYLKLGNHDLRRELMIQRLSATMPELQGYTSYQDYLFYEGSNVQFIEDYKHVTFGKLNIMHGHEYPSNGIHIAYNRLNKTFDNVLSAHSHRGQSIIRQTINREVYGSWTIGCLCNLSPRYAPKNDWVHGYAIIERDNEGLFEVQNKIIRDEKLFYI